MAETENCPDNQTVDDSLFIRRMTEADIPLGMKLKQIAGWNQVERDWHNFLSFRPGGCFVAEWEGTPAATVTTIDYQGRVGWVGMLLVDPDFRRLGIGTALLEKGIESLGDCEAVKLDATAMGKYVYVQRGFYDEVLVERWTRVDIPSETLPPIPATSVPVRSMVAEDLPGIIEWDAGVFGVAREQVLGAWLKDAPKYALIAEEGGEIAGYCLGRVGSRFDQIGPLVGRSEKLAKSLFLKALVQTEGKPVVLDTFTDRSEWTSLLRDLGFEFQREFYRMARGESVPMLKPEWYWLSTGPEIG